MQVKFINKTSFTQYIDTDGDENNHDTTVILGPKATITVDVSSERQFLNLSNELKNKVIVRKV